MTAPHAYTAPTLGELDRDEALSDAVAVLYGDSRAEFLRKAAVGSAAMLAALAAPAEAAGKLTDTAIFDYALRFEYLQATFYTETERVGTVGRMSSEKERWARVLGAHERAHVKVIKGVLGRKASKKPFFDFKGITESEAKFVKTAVAMEDLTIALLTGVVPKIQDRKLTAAAFGLLTTEARHAAWARHLVGVKPVIQALDQPKTVGQVDRFINGTNFIVSRPKTSTRRRRPRFTG